MKKISIVLCVLMIFSFACTAFADGNYTVSDWAADEVKKAEELRLIPAEMPNDLTGNITRREFAETAVNLFEVLSKEDANFVECPFTDIRDDDARIMQAYTLGITMGVSETEFAPDLSITREQLATMLLRTIVLSTYADPTKARDISGAKKFDDDNLISDYAKEATYFMSSCGIIKGVDETHFDPQNTATREQAILLALRIYDSFEELRINIKKE
ncbi:MAG: S-layer homology domain-containing protein [Clostridia bacterium]|nr:S-layer homology domain-containing protein [Clostridia bacterium]